MIGFDSGYIGVDFGMLEAHIDIYFKRSARILGYRQVGYRDFRSRLLRCWCAC